MDALKKAEKEKREAAKRLKESEEKSRLDLTLEEEMSDADPSSDELTKKHPETDLDSKEDDKDTSGEFTLAPIEDEEETAIAEDNKPTQDQPSANETTRLADTGEDIGSDPDLTLEKPPILDLDETQEVPDAAVPEQREDDIASLSVDEEYVSPLDDSGIHERLDEDLLKESTLSRSFDDSKTSQGALSARELASELEAADPRAPKPVAAQTVFSASGGKSNRRQFVYWALFILCFASIVMGVSFFYYIQTTPVITPPARPVIAETEISQLPALEESAATAIVESNAASVEESQSEAPGRTNEVIEPAQPARSGAAGGADETIVNAESPSSETPMIESDRGAVSPPLSTAPPQLSEQIQVSPEALKISRSRTARESDVLLQSAYTHYQSGRYSAARSEYQAVLDELPENRDALLGLAAIALGEGNIKSAYDYYLKVVQLYPSDVIARTALLRLAGDTSSSETETMLKLMIEESPQTAALHFSLGNVYASVSRWNEAQQAFLEAYRLESDNPDYVYNLAVSFDRLGQRETALQYYQRALGLAERRPAALNRAGLAARITALSGSISDQ